jgi:hypothetical protein
MLESAAGVCEPPAAWFVGVFTLAMLSVVTWSVGWFEGCGVKGRDCSGAGPGIEAAESAVLGFEEELGSRGGVMRSEVELRWSELEDCRGM